MKKNKRILGDYDLRLNVSAVSLDSFKSDKDKVISFAKWLIMSEYAYNEKENIWQQTMMLSIGRLIHTKKTGEELYSEFKKGDV